MFTKHHRPLTPAGTVGRAAAATASDPHSHRAVVVQRVLHIVVDAVLSGERVVKILLIHSTEGVCRRCLQHGITKED